MTFEEVEVEHEVVEPTLHVIKAAMLLPAWKVVVEAFSPILHVLDETLHKITPQTIVDMMLQAEASTGIRVPVGSIRVDGMTAIPVDQALKEELSSQDITRTAEIEP